MYSYATYVNSYGRLFYNLDTSREIHHRLPSCHVQQPDVSEYMLALPNSRRQFRGWIFIAIATGTLLALVLFAISNLIS